MATVDEIQAGIAGTIDLDPEVSHISAEDYALRLKYINRRERAWSEIGKWQCLIKEYNTLTSTNSGNCSISLPVDFRSLSVYPEITFDGVHTVKFPEIRPQEEAHFDKESSQYIKIMGNPYSGYTMVVNPATSDKQLASGASIKVLYFSTPASLASPTDVVTCPNPEYLIEGVIADIWGAQEDARFQAAKAQANITLSNMLEFEFTPSEAAYNRGVKTYEQRYGFKWGK